MTNSCPSLCDRFTQCVGTAFGLGYAPLASGTFGALPGALLAYGAAALTAHWTLPALLASQVLFALLLTILAIPICDVSERLFGEKDDGRIVADEMLTFPACTIGIPLLAAPWWMLGAFFVINRVSDIIKPAPARRLQDLHGGLGIVADDFVACLYALAANHALYWGWRAWCG